MMLVFYSARLLFDKGYHRAIKLFEFAYAQTDIKMVFAGKVDGEREVMRLAEKYPQHVFYLGYLTDKDLLAAWYASSDIVFALGVDTFGHSAVEALASGCSLISNDAGSTVEFI